MIYTFGYIVLTAISMVFIHQLGSNIPEMLMVFLTTAYAMVFFHVASIGSIRTSYSTALKQKGLFTNVQIAVALMWFSTFFVSIHYAPAFSMFTNMAWTSLIGLGVASGVQGDAWKKGQAAGIFLVLAIFYVRFAIHNTVPEFLILFVSTSIGGITMYWYLHLSCRMGRYQLKPIQILAMRFWLLLLAALIITVIQQDYLVLSGSMLWSTLLLALFSLIAPIFCSQKSVEKIGGNATAILVGLTPFSTFVLQKMFTSAQDNFIGYLSAFLALLIALPWIHDLLRKARGWRSTA